MAEENGKTVEEWVEELEGLAEEEKWTALKEKAVQYTSLHPRNPDGYHYHICALMGQTRFQDAVSVGEDAIKNNIFNETVIFKYSQCLYQVGGYNSAIDFFTALINTADGIGTNPNYYRLRGSCFAELEDFDSAINDFNEAIQLFENQDYQDIQLLSELYKNRGGVYYDLKNFKYALKDLHKALKLVPNYAPALDNLGNTYVALGQINRALDYYSKAIELDNSSFQTHWNRGLAYDDLKQIEKAIEDYNKAIELSEKKLKETPNDRIALNIRLSAEKNKTILIMQGENQRNLDELNKIYNEYHPKKLVRLYDNEINEIEKELYGREDRHKLFSVNESDNSQLLSWLLSFWQLTKRFLSSLSLFPIGIALLTFTIPPPSCYEGVISLCLIKSILYDHRFWLVLAFLLTLSRMQNWADTGLVEKSRRIAGNLRVIFILIFVVMIEINFKVFNIVAEPIGDLDNTFDLLRYAASVIFLITPFILYYHHIKNRANQLHILTLALRRERRNLMFWVAQTDKDINSPKNQFAKQILSHMTKNAAADIGVRMLHPKLDQGRRWSLFGFGGNAFSELEDKLEGLTDVIKRLELREPKQDEDKQKTKGNDTVVGAKTDNK